MTPNSTNVAWPRPVHHRRRAVAYFMCAIFLVAADLLFIAKASGATPAYTPYANSVQGTSGTTAAGTPENAVGAPDGQTTGPLGVNSSITLDMGAGEEGTASLKVYFGSVNVNEDINVAFLDSNLNVISQEQRSLFFNSSSSTSTFAYDWHDSGKAYRFVKLTNTAGAGFDLDAVEALGFIGSTPTQDTDGDGIPDRQDAQPLVFNQSSSSSTTNNGTNPVLPHSTASSSTTTTTAGQVNNPVPAALDSDHDGMPDSWEVAHGLNPSKNDANLDPDHDGLPNLQEYAAGTDPHKADTDGDGMPDGWEVKNGLNPLVSDGNQDPDGDYLTNLGEYHFGTNPFRADKVSVNAKDSAAFCATTRPLSARDWWIFWLLLLAAALSLLTSWVLSAGPSPSDTSSPNYRFRHRLYRAFRPGGKVS